MSIGTSLSNRPLTTLDKSLITSSTSLLALFISPFASVIADRFGRKRVILIGDLLFIVGALVQALTSSVWGMILGRSLVGLAVGAASFVAPLYIGELAPAPFRGRLVTLSVLNITLGQVVAYVVGWALSENGGQVGWRWMVGLGAIPAVCQVLIMLIMPESPRWLVKSGRVEEARVVLSKVFGPGLELQKMLERVLKGIEHEVQAEERARKGRNLGSDDETETWLLGSKDTWKELFRVGGNRRALTIACLLQGLQQLCGFVSSLLDSARRYTRNLIVVLHRIPSCTFLLPYSSWSDSILPHLPLSPWPSPTSFSLSSLSFSSMPSAVAASSCIPYLP